MSAPGELIARRYRLKRRVGAGGMGEVWEAFDERLQRRVAVKQLHAQPWLSDDEADVVTQRAMREARITARLHHAHAVPVYDVVEDEHRPCLVMQFLPSEPLSSVLQRRGALPEAEVAELGRQLASALEAAHQVGIVHRDVKPGNVLVAEDGTARISDFGIAHALGDVALTSTGIVAGTLEYLAPEVARGHGSGFAADVFSLGATLYAAAEGRPPFGTDPNRMALLHRVAAGGIDAPTRSGSVTSLLVEMLAADPDERPTMSEVAARLTVLCEAQRAQGAAAASAGASTAATALPPTAPMPAVAEDFPTSPYRPPRPFAATVVSDSPGGGQGAPPGDSAQPPPPVASAQPPPAVASEPPPPPVASAQPPPAVVSEPPPPPVRRADRHAAAANRPRRRRGAVAAVVVAVLLLLVPVVALLQSRDDGAVVDAAPPPVSASASVSATSGPTSTPSAAPSALAAAPSAALPTRSAPSAVSSPAPTSAAPPAAAAGALTAAESARAVSSYYSLLPGNTDAAWPLMTASYQANKAGGRQSYQQFWSTFSRVTATDVTAVGASTVEATISYYRKDGQVIRERTSFGLVKDGGVVKIDTSRIVGAAAG